MRVQEGELVRHPRLQLGDELVCYPDLSATVDQALYRLERSIGTIPILLELSQWKQNVVFVL